MPYATAQDGTRIYYKDWGQGRPVVLIHGWPLSSDTFDDAALALAENGRSEEHTSELQSLMRISYAVFCLKKKKYTNNDNYVTSEIILKRKSDHIQYYPR